MNVKPAIDLMRERSGMSAYAISKALGHAPHWMGQLMRNAGDDLRCATVVAVAGQCGYRLALVPDTCELPGDAIIID